MTKRELYTQESLDLELREFEDVLGSSFCELVEGEIPTDFMEESTDKKLQDALRARIKLLLKDSSKPQVLMYQLSSGQRSIICLSVDENKKLIVGYRDLDSRPPSKRVKQSIDEVVKEFME